MAIGRSQMKKQITDGPQKRKFAKTRKKKRKVLV
jgi:hypothetical protein